LVKANAFDPWTLLGDSNRRAIIERLPVGPCTVTELAEAMPISRPAVSQHLKVLKGAGIVEGAQAGRHCVYSLDEKRLERYRRQLDQFWAGALGNLAAATCSKETGTG
jgi:DNA-binding transcriptional ArsR family regulator